MNNESFASNLEDFGKSIAVVTETGVEVSYQSLVQMADELSNKMPNTDYKQLMLIAADNSLQAIVAYIASLRQKIPVILIPHDKPDAYDNIFKQFRPTLTYIPNNGDYILTHYEDHVPSESHFARNMAVCLSTSGTTGSAKLVKLSAKNLDANAHSIATYLQLDSSERAILSLPMYYSYGLSVINSHLSIGASIVLNNESVVEETFWTRFNQHECTSFAGVPYSYELLNRSGFAEKDIPTLRYMTQAGGKLPKELVVAFSNLAEQKGYRFYVMYGQTEATARMSYLPPEEIASHVGSMGVVIPGGRFELVDEQDNLITDVNQSGELIYYGDNVMMGYAKTREDLFVETTLDSLRTGDIAWRDADDFYYISGRKSRFLKIFGNRIGLDDVESTLRGLGYVTICGGTDQHLVVLTLEEGKAAEVSEILAEKFQLNSQYAYVEEVKDFPLLPNGKIDYAKLTRIAEEKTLVNKDDTPSNKDRIKSLFGFGEKSPHVSALSIFQRVFPAGNVTEESTFFSLGGDSLNYVQMITLLEKRFGDLPDTWQALKVSEIDQLDAKPKSLLTFVETSVLLRAIAILAVVANHTHLLSNSLIGGGSILLFLLVGYSAARFQLQHFVASNIWKPIWNYLKVVLLLYMFVTVASIATQSVNMDFLLMVSNFYRFQADSVAYLWFVQVLIQTFVALGIFMSLSNVRKSLKKATWRTSFVMLAVFSILGLASNNVWDFSHLDYRLPQFYLPIFLLGWCIYLAKTGSQKLIMIGFLTLFSYVAYEQNIYHLDIPRLIWLYGGALVLTLFPKIPKPSVVKPILMEISAAALYIYMFHQIFHHFLRYVTENSLIIFSLSIVCSLILYRTIDLITNSLRKK